jgi:hypothetical protein
MYLNQEQTARGERWKLHVTPENTLELAGGLTVHSDTNPLAQDARIALLGLEQYHGSDRQQLESKRRIAGKLFEAMHLRLYLPVNDRWKSYFTRVPLASESITLADSILAMPDEEQKIYTDALRELPKAGLLLTFDRSEDPEASYGLFPRPDPENVK